MRHAGTQTIETERLLLRPLTPEDAPMMYANWANDPDVTRGICKMDDQNNLTEVVETKNIVKTADGAEADGKVIDVDSLVSMNMWGLPPQFLDVLESGFVEFLDNLDEKDAEKKEYLLPKIIDKLLAEKRTEVTLLETPDKWFGVTYKEDKPLVVEAIRGLIETGVY